MNLNNLIISTTTAQVASYHALPVKGEYVANVNAFGTTDGKCMA